MKKGRFVGIKYETHPFWLAVFYALGMIGYNIMLLDENADMTAIESCVKLGDLAAIIGKENEEYSVRNIAFNQLIKNKELRSLSATQLQSYKNFLIF